MSPQAQQTPTMGRQVYFVLPEGQSKGQSRAATVARVWPKVEGEPQRIQVKVTLDEANDYGAGSFYSSVPEGGPEQLGTWYWPPRA